MRLPTYDKPRIIACAEDYPRHIGLPRGCMEDVQQLLSELNIMPVARDERCHGRPLSVAFQGTLRPEQKAAADSMLKHETGVLAATTAFGKTVVAAWLIAQRGVNTLVLVHRRQLLDQWVERLSTFLNINDREIGRIGGGRLQPTGPAALDKRVEFQSLYGDLLGDQSRNRRICDDVVEAVQSGRSPLVLTERNDHLDSLNHQLTGRVRHVIVLRGGMGKKQREA